jgi:hypothetical protein
MSTGAAFLRLISSRFACSACVVQRGLQIVGCDSTPSNVGSSRRVKKATLSLVTGMHGVVRGPARPSEFAKSFERRPRSSRAGGILGYFRSIEGFS